MKINLKNYRGIQESPFNKGAAERSEAGGSLTSEKYANAKGITLIALIITIIIMLILVAVSVRILIDSNLIGIAEETADKTKTAYEKESNLSEVTINGKTYGSIDEYVNGGKIPEIKLGERATSNSTYTDNNGKTAVIPAGFTVSGIKNETADETTIEGGLVIYDIPQKDLDDGTVDWEDPETVKPVYNQFVWIPVAVNKTVDTPTSIASFYRSEWTNSTDGGARTTGLDTGYTEPYSYNDEDYDGENGTGIKAQIEKLTESIYNNGGFYIGRYEAGVAGDTPRSSEYESQTASFVVQQDKYPYNYIVWGTNMGDVSTEGAVYLSNKLYSSTNSNYGATSMLCTGACWDAMLDFVKDSDHNVTSSAAWGNYYGSETYKVYRGSYYSSYYSSSWTASDPTNGTEVIKGRSILLTTGATERNSSKNIYDVAGNCKEWTTEACCYIDPYGEFFTRARVLRDGYSEDGEYDSSYHASYRYNLDPSYFGYRGIDYSFRPALYVE